MSLPRPWEQACWPPACRAKFLRQTKNNIDPDNRNRPWLLIRENADDYLHELALADDPPSGTKYIQNGKAVKSQGVHEHWDDDETRRYSRNLDPEKGTGIELVYTKID